MKCHVFFFPLALSVPFWRVRDFARQCWACSADDGKVDYKNSSQSSSMNRIIGVWNKLMIRACIKRSSKWKNKNIIIPRRWCKNITRDQWINVLSTKLLLNRGEIKGIKNVAKERGNEHSSMASDFKTFYEWGIHDQIQFFI